MYAGLKISLLLNIFTHEQPWIICEKFNSLKKINVKFQIFSEIRIEKKLIGFPKAVEDLL